MQVAIVEDSTPLSSGLMAAEGCCYRDGLSSWSMSWSFGNFHLAKRESYIQVDLCNGMVKVLGSGVSRFVC